MNKILPFIFSDYVAEIIDKINVKYGIDTPDALRRFLYSETYRMLVNPKLEMWEFTPDIIFETWECEQITGNPRNSIYIKGE